MTDDQELVKRLRQIVDTEGDEEAVHGLVYAIREAADAIERLVKEVEAEMSSYNRLIEEHQNLTDALDVEKLRHAMLFDELTQAQTERDAAFTAGALAMREACATVLEHPNAGLEPPDGGSPTRQEMLANISAAIRAIDPASVKS